MAKLTIGSPTGRGLNSVQAFLRLVLWLVSMAVLFGITMVLAGVLSAASEFLGPATLAVGGFVSLILAIMVSRTIYGHYLTPGEQRVAIEPLADFVLRLGESEFTVESRPGPKTADKHKGEKLKTPSELDG
jgi:hypothetical protein